MPVAFALAQLGNLGEAGLGEISALATKSATTAAYASIRCLGVALGAIRVRRTALLNPTA